MDDKPRKGQYGKMQRDMRGKAAAKGNKSGIVRSGRLKHAVFPIGKRK